MLCLVALLKGLCKVREEIKAENVTNHLGLSRPYLHANIYFKSAVSDSGVARLFKMRGRQGGLRGEQGGLTGTQNGGSP